MISTLSTRWPLLRRRVAQLVSRLIEPTNSLQGIEARLNARLLAALLLAVAGMGLVGALLISGMADPVGVAALLWGATVPLLGLYALSRTRYYKWAAALNILFSALMPYLTLALAAPRLTPEQQYFALSMLYLPIVLASLFFTTRITAICATLIALSLLLIPVFMPGVDRAAVNMALGLILTVSILVVVLMEHRERIERARRAALADSEARYRRLADNAPDIIYRYTVAPQERLAYINPAVSDLLGHTPEEFYADPDLLFNLVHPDYRSALRAMIAPNAPRDIPTTLRWMRRDGVCVWIEHRHVPVFDQAGNLIAVEGVARDITERKRLEDMLRQSEASLAEAQRMAHVGSWTWDLATDQLHFSDEMFRLVGLRPREAQITPEVFFQFLHPEETEWIRHRLQRVSSEPTLTGVEHRIVRPGGEIRYAHSEVKIYRDENGRSLRLLGSTQDITDRKQAEIQIERNLRQLIALERMGQTVVASLDLTVVLRRIIEQISTLLGAEGVSVLLLEDHDELVFVAADSRSAALIGQRMPIGAGVAGEVIRTGQSVRVHDSASQARIYRDIDQTIGFRTESLLAVPLNLRGEIIGVMEAVHTQPGAFNSDDLHLLEAAASWATVAITNARLFKAERRRVQEQVALLEITQMALSSFEFSAPMLKHIAQRIAQACHASQCLLFLFEEPAGVIRPIVTEYADGREDPDIQQVLPIIAAERLDTLPALRMIMSERRPHLFKDVRQASLLPDEWRRLFGLQQVLAVPLLSQTEAIGLMIVGYESDRVVGESYFDLALTIGAQIAIAFANMHLYADLQRALRDEREARAQVVQAEKLTALGRLAATLAHEINNPLQAITSDLELILDFPLDKDEQLARLRVIRQEIDRLSEMTRSVLTFSRPSLAPRRIVPITDLIQQTLSLAHKKLQHSHIQVTTQWQIEPVVRVVPDQLVQVFLNLIINAIEAIYDHGQIHISVEVEEEQVITRLRNDGPPIASEDLARIFEPFFTTKEGGTGLGLAVSHNIVTQHGGTLSAENLPNARGVAFTVRLPLASRYQAAEVKT